jgi:tRNA nucleotidyltransferase (CCA-adding enzyme)
MIGAASFEPQTVLDALRRRPEGAALLAAAERAPHRVALVGGFVRDTLLGVDAREVDVLIEGDAQSLAGALGGTVTLHEQFGTACVRGAGWTVDLASSRSERYAQPGALPLVAPASLEADLGRRDFTINAIAVELPHGERFLAAASALADLAGRRLRVLHDASFIDDPTRVLRLARYARRLGLEVDPHTATLAGAATLASVSGARIGAEVRLALLETDPIGLFEDFAAKLPIVVDRSLIEAALALAPADADGALLTLAAVCDGAAPPAWVQALELTARERDTVVAARGAPALAEQIAAAASASALRGVLRGVPVEIVALAGAHGPRAAVARWFDELRAVRLEIDGDDLIAAGVAPGPDLGGRLERTLERKLDGQLSGGRAAELASALADGG